MNKIISMLAAIAVFAVLGGCATLPPGISGYYPSSANEYTTYGAQTAQQVSFGTVLSVRGANIRLEGYANYTASGIGAAVGGLIGNQMGGSWRGRQVTTAIGSLVGAVAGTAISEQAYRQPGVVVTVQLDAGRYSPAQVVAVTQAADVPVYTGQRVEVVGSGYAGSPARVYPVGNGASYAQ